MPTRSNAKRRERERGGKLSERVRWRLVVAIKIDNLPHSAVAARRRSQVRRRSQCALSLWLAITLALQACVCVCVRVRVPTMMTRLSAATGA